MVGSPLPSDCLEFLGLLGGDGSGRSSQVLCNVVASAHLGIFASWKTR